MIKVRFHLGAGGNFMNWQVTRPEGVEYYDPGSVQLYLRGCKLRNRPATAEKIYGGSNKQVCAWVDCKEVHIVEGIDVGTQIRFNPKIAPNWHTNWQADNLDGAEFSELVTDGRSVCLPL